MGAQIQRSLNLAAAPPSSLPPRLAPRQRFVEIVRPRPGERRDHARGRPWPSTRLNEMSQGVDREADVFVVLGGGGGADDEDDLAFDVAAEAAGELGEAAAGDLLVDLGQLAADGGLAIGRQRGEGGEGLADA